MQLKLIRQLQVGPSEFSTVLELLRTACMNENVPGNATSEFLDIVEKNREKLCLVDDKQINTSLIDSFSEE